MANLMDLFVRITADNTEYKKALKESREHTEAFANLAEAAGVRIGGALSLAGVAVAAVEAAEKFEAAGFKIRQVTGATGEKLEGLEKSLQNIYASSTRGADEIAGVLSQLSIRTGLEGSALEALATATLRFVKVAGGDLQETVKSNEKLFAQWSISTADQSRAMDMLYVASTKSGQAAEYFTGALTTMGPTLRAFGYSFSEAVALIGTFARAGLDASEATRGLNTMFAKLAAAGKDPRAELQLLIEKLSDTKSSTQAAADLIEAGFSKRAVLGMVDALKRGALSIDDFKSEIDGSAGAVKRAAAETETLSAKWTKLLHTLQVDLQPTGSYLLDFFGVIVEGAAGAIKAVEKLAAALFKLKLPDIKSAQTLAEFDEIMGKSGMDPKILAKLRAEFAAAHPDNTPPSTLDQGGGGGAAAADPVASLANAYKALGLKDLNKELAESIRAFQALAAAGTATHDQMLKAAEGIRKLRAELGQTKTDPGYIAYVAALGQKWGAKMPTLDDLRNLPTVVREGDVQNLVTYNRNLQLLNDTLAASVNAASLAQRNVDALTDAYHELGLKTPAEIRQSAKDSEAAWDLIRKDGEAVPEAIYKAWEQMFRDKLAAQLLDHKITKEQYDQMLAELDASHQASANRRTKMERSISDELGRQLKGTIEAFERNLARAIVTWKGGFEVIKNLGRDLAESLLSSFLKGLFKPLEDEMEKLGKRIGGMFDKIWGSSGSAPSPSGGGGGIPGGGGGGGAAGGASGLAGTVTAVAGVATAISSVVGNFQMAGMNKSLDVLVNHTLRIFNELTNFRKDAWDRHAQWFTRTAEIWQASLDIKDILGRGISTSGGGKGGYTFTNCTFYGTPQQGWLQTAFDQAENAGAFG